VTASLVIRRAAELLTMAGSDHGRVPDGAAVIEGGCIAWTGPDRALPAIGPGARVIDASGCVVMPGFVDCHTHLVFDGWRADEYEMRLAGRSYKEIAQAGGGILATVRSTRAASEPDLHDSARSRLDEMLAWGTTTCEIKSGYGLDTDTELKMLRIIRRLGKEGPQTIVPTFMGAHSLPPEQSRESYIRLLIDEMLPAVAAENLARFCDVFCENFVFTADESRRILQAAVRHGLTPKLHADEIEPSGGAELAAELDAVSAEHLLRPSDKGLQAMKEKNVIAVLLPGTSFVLRTAARSPVARMRELGLTMALGSDFNPGSCTLSAMPVVISLACLHYGLTIPEALRGATINAARALNLDNRLGSLEPGKQADILILDIPDYRHIPYRLAHNPVKTVIIRGEPILLPALPAAP
jgi:imidazolonepropionase